MKAHAQIDLTSGGSLRSPLPAANIAQAIEHPPARVIALDTIDGHGRVRLTYLPAESIVAVHALS